MPGGVISVVVVDDQALIRSGVRAMIEAAPDLRVVGEAADGAEGARVVAATDPDVVVMDVQMPDADGIAGLTALVESGARARVLMLTMFDLDHYVLEALRIGASGFLLKTTPPDRLVAAIRDVHRGDRAFAPSVVDRLVRTYVDRPADPEVPPALAALSPRERDVLRALTRGLSNAEIAGELFLTEATVKTYVTRILTKLGLRDRVQAVILAYESGWHGRSG